jgi:GT2 family glycosyltransferase
VSARISVVIPTLGRADALTDTLAFIGACDPPPDELVVVDGEPALTGLAAAQAAELGGITLVAVSSPPGVSRQRNLGIERATGKLLVFLDDDVRVQRDFFAVVAEVTSDPTIVAATGYVDEPRSRRIFAQQSRIRRLLPGGGAEGNYTRYGYPHYLRDPMRVALDVEFMQGCLMVVRREAARTVGFDERLAVAEDEDFAYRLTRLGRVRYDPRLRLVHRKLGFLNRDRRAADRELIVSRRYIARKNFALGRRARLELDALAVGLALHRLANLDLQGARGIVDGMRTPSPVEDHERPRPDGGDLADLVRLLHPAGPAAPATDVVMLRSADDGDLAAAARATLVYLEIAPLDRGGAARQLRRSGLRHAGALVRRPRGGDARLLVPLRPEPSRYVVESLTPAGRRTRRAARLGFGVLGSLTARFAPTVGHVFVRGEAAPLAWLGFAGEPVSVERCALLRTGSGVRLLLFDDARPRPTRVVVVGAPVHDPGPVSATAARAGAAVPEALAVENVGGVRIRVESAVPGALAAAHLQKEPADLARLLGVLADWLARWHAATARATLLTPELVDARLVRPARECRDVVGDAYVARVEAAAAGLVGRTVDLVDAHCDLTMWNVFVDGSRLGVIDWETAGSGAFPVGDFVYAAVDAASALAGYRDRAAAFERCFTPGGELARELDELVRRVAAAASVGPGLLPVVFHASFLHHAANERREAAGGGEAPFRKIAARLAEGDLVAWAALEMLS